MAMPSIPYLGSKISLISKSEIRYEGTLYTIDTKESTVALAKVRSFGTEDRPTDRPVAPRSEVYEYIIFRGPDIKDIVVCQGPKPQPTLEGGLPNDPAIVQHSAVGAVGPATRLASNVPLQNAPKQSAANYGSVPAPASFPHPPGRRLSEISPVMDFLRGGSRRESSSNGQNQAQTDNRRGFGGQSRGQVAPGFHRGGRGRGSFRQPRGGQQRYQNNVRFTQRSESSGFQPGRPAKVKEPIKFENEFDFEQANEEFKDFLSKFEKATLEDKDEGKTEKASGNAEQEKEIEEGEIRDEVKILDAFYDKNKSFFDKISCEALQKSAGEKEKPDWKAQRKLNRETFGATGNFNSGRGRGQFYRGRGRSGNGGGYNRNRGGGRNVNGSNNYYNNNKSFYSGFINGYGRFSRENVPSAYVGRRTSTSSGYQQHQPPQWGQQRGGRGNFRGQRGRQWVGNGRIF